MNLQGRGIYEGEAEGEVVKVDGNVSFLGDVDPATGEVFDEKDISGSIFVFPGGKGSTVGSYVIYQLKKEGTAPVAMINELSETIVASGAIISEIPLVDKIDLDLIREGDRVKVDGEKGVVELKGVELHSEIGLFLEKDGSILLRKEEVKGKTGKKWSILFADKESQKSEKLLDQARLELSKEIKGEFEFLSKGGSVSVREANKIREIHPLLFKVKDDLDLGRSDERYRWTDPGEIKDMDTVPKLWESYLSVRDEYES